MCGIPDLTFDRETDRSDNLKEKLELNFYLGCVCIEGLRANRSPTQTVSNNGMTQISVNFTSTCGFLVSCTSF